MSQWWQLPSWRQPSGWQPHSNLLTVEPPGGQLAFVDTGDGWLYSRSCVMSNFHYTLELGKLRFTSARDPAFESWLRKAMYEDEKRIGLDKLNDDAREGLAHMTTEGKKAYVAGIERGEGFESFNIKSTILKTIEWLRKGGSRGTWVNSDVGYVGTFQCDGSDWAPGDKDAPKHNTAQHDEHGRPIFTKGSK